MSTLAVLNNAPRFEPPRRLPGWLRRPIPPRNANHFTRRLLDELRLETVCDNARCPNRMECYARKTATFMLLGIVCTRSCGFCAVSRGRPGAVEADEPDRVAEAAARMGLRHVVLTSVTRDDLADGGADHFYRSVLAVRERTGATVEVLTPDFRGDLRAVDRVLAAMPDVFNHNLETVPRLCRRVRGRGSHRTSLAVLRRAKGLGADVKTKSGLMLGLGETADELLEALADLRDVPCDYLTLGQYLQPGERYLPVVRYVPPDEFDAWGRRARAMGFEQVASGPFVRSSYHAAEMIAAET